MYSLRNWLIYCASRVDISTSRVLVMNTQLKITHTQLNTSRPIQNGRHFPDDTFKCLFLNGNIWINIDIPMYFVPKGQINNIPALFQMMAWRRLDDKRLSEPMLVVLLAHIYAVLVGDELMAWYDDVIKWKHFPRYWPFVRRIPDTKASDAEL